MRKTTKIVTILLISIFCLTLFTSSAKAATTGMWTYGGDQYDTAISNIETADGSHIIVGTTDSYGAVADDLWIFKVDANGTMDWTQHYGGSGNDSAYNVIATSDGGYAIVGSTTSYGSGGEDVWLVKVDSAGNMQWNKAYGESGDDEGWMLLQSGDGGYVIAGYTDSYSNVSGIADALLIKTDSAGNMQWNRTYGGVGDDGLYGITKASDGGYALSGFTNSTGSGGYDAWLIKVDSAGYMQWNKTYGGSQDDIAYVVRQTVDGGYILDATTQSYGAGDADAWLIKTDSNGNIVWNHTYGGTDDDHAWYLIPTSEGGYALAGYSYSYSSQDTADLWIVKVDSTGQEQWNQTYGDDDNDYFAWSIAQTKDGGYAVAGEVDTYDSNPGDAFLLISDSSGIAQISNGSDPLQTLLLVAVVIVVVMILVIVVAFVLLRGRRPRQPL